MDTLEYATSRGGRYSFSGWEPGLSPSECFDEAKYLECLHGCILCLSLLNEPFRTQKSVEDDGLIHELVHLSQGIDISHRQDMLGLRKEVANLQSALSIQLTLWRQQ